MPEPKKPEFKPASRLEAPTKASPPKDESLPRAEPPHGKAEVVRQGTLYSANAEEIRLFNKDGLAPSDAYPVREGKDAVSVTLNGGETCLDDLKRGDQVTLTGDPIYGVEATR